MDVNQAKQVARQWVEEEASNLPGFRGAFCHGSTVWLPGETILPAASDVDVVVVFDSPEVPLRTGKRVVDGALLDVTLLQWEEIASPETVLGNHHVAGSFRDPQIIADPTGALGTLQRAVADDYAKRYWVERRCENARSKIVAFFKSIDEARPYPDNVSAWLFATGITTHVLLVAGMKNPTVRKRYLAVQELLAQYGLSSCYEPLLDQLGARQMSRSHVEAHLESLVGAFDAAASAISTPVFFASDISERARPIAIGGSREMIERGDHREAVFWIVATWARCMTVFHRDAPELEEHFAPGFQAVLGDLGVNSLADLRQRGQQVEALLPELWQLAQTIMDANPDIEE